MELVKLGTTSKIIDVFLRDSTTGQGKTGVTAASMSGFFTDGNSAETSLSFAAGTIGDAYSSGKWAEGGGGNYKYHAPNGLFDQLGRVRARFVSSGTIDAKVDFQVVAFDPNDANGLGLAYVDYSIANVVSDVTAEIGVVGGQTTAIKAKTDQMAFTTGLVQVVLHDATAAGLAKFVTDDTGETSASDGSVAKLSQGGAGGGDTAAIVTGVLAGLTDPVVLSQPVATSGQITEPIIIGDDYLASNGRAFQWTVDEVTGVVAATATCFFGVSHPKKGSFIVEGTVTDNGDGTWLLSFDVTRADTQDLLEGEYGWSVEVRDADSNEITRVRNASGCRVTLIDKQT